MSILKGITFHTQEAFEEAVAKVIAKMLPVEINEEYFFGTPVRDISTYKVKPSEDYVEFLQKIGAN